MRGEATYEERCAIEAVGLGAVSAFVLAHPATLAWTPASAESQKRDDIDFSWTFWGVSQEPRTRTVEVKVDTQGHETGNYAFETVSNESRASPGCILRTQADILFYYFVGSRELHMSQTRRLREWFLRELASKPKRFRTFETYTLVGNECYCAFGRLVPIREVPCMRVVHIP